MINFIFYFLFLSEKADAEQQLADARDELGAAKDEIAAGERRLAENQKKIDIKPGKPPSKYRKKARKIIINNGLTWRNILKKLYS